MSDDLANDDLDLPPELVAALEAGMTPEQLAAIESKTARFLSEAGVSLPALSEALIQRLRDASHEQGKSPTDLFPSVPMPRVEPFQSAVSYCHTEDRFSRGRRILMAYPQAIFRGEGLWLWGADETTLIHNIKTGNQNCFSLSHVAIPGLYFEAGLSFEEFEELLEKAPAEWSHERLKKLPPLAAHQRVRMLTAEVGNSLVLDVEGPLTHAVVWGKTVQ